MPALSGTASIERTGLIGKDVSIPLEGVSVETELTDLSARVTITQRYRNTETQAIEAVYVFPLDEQAAVCGFEAIVAGVHFVGDIKPREEAFKAYDDALIAGHSAYLLDEERPDVFTVSVGRIPPGAEVLLKVTYLTELVLEGDAIRFTLPTTVSPRYAPVEDRTGVGRSPAEAVSPPVMWEVPYGLDFTMQLSMPGTITRVESPSHPISVALAGAKATVTLSQRQVALDRDVIVLVECERLHEPHVRVERDADGRLAATFVARPTIESAQAAAEVVFLVDRSGSMEGSSIAEVRNALQLCLRSLTPGCRFNIVGFGTTFTSLFEGSVLYSEESLARATAHVKALEADLGGTEIRPALDFVFSRPGISGLPRQLVVLTDGDVTNTDAVLGLVAQHAHDTRTFAFGIGRGASAHLVRGLARVGRGTAEFVYPGERIEPKVLRQFARLLVPALTDVVVDWGGLKATAVPSAMPPIFDGQRIVAYAFLDDVHNRTVTVSAKSGDQSVSFSATLDQGQVSAGRTIGTLAARARIRELEEQPQALIRRGSRQRDRTIDRDRDEIVRLATAYQLMSRETSFVAIEHRVDATPGDLVLRRLPVALRSGWGGEDQARPKLLLHDTGAIPIPVAAPSAPMPMASRSAASPMADLLSDAGQTLRKGFGLFRRRPGLSGPSGPSGHSAQSDRPLDHLVAGQRADGSWDLTTVLASVAHIELNVLEQRMPSMPGAKLPKRVWATSLALAWLELRAAANRDEWALLARKAESWLQAAAMADVITATRLVAEETIAKFG